MEDRTTEIYEAVGNDAPFYALVEVFYQGVEQDPVLRRLYPDDLSEAKEHLALFLIQRFGGHGAYSTKRGHPRLRMRHVPFTIGLAERDAWLTHMMNAVRAVSEFAPHSAALETYFTDAANFLVNKAAVPSLS